MENKKPYYLTTAITYTSGKPHIGNVYEIVLADAICRYKRMTGYDVLNKVGQSLHFDRKSKYYGRCLALYHFR